MSVALVRLDAGQLEDLAELLAEKLPKGPPMSPLVGVAEVAAYLSVDASWVYAHAAELGVRRLGSGPKAALGFSLEEVDQRLSTCDEGRGSNSQKPAQTKPSRRRRARLLGTNVRLLPIRGQKVPENGAAASPAPA